MNEAKGLVVWLQTGLENSLGGEHSLFADKIGNKHFFTRTSEIPTD